MESFTSLLFLQRYAFINFFIFVGILFFSLRKPLAEFWRERALELQRRVAAAKAALVLAEARYQVLLKRAERLEAEMASVRRELQTNGELEKQKILDHATQEASRLSDLLHRLVEQENLKRQYQLRRKIVESVLQATEAAIRQSLQPADQDRLVGQALGELGAKDWADLKSETSS